MKTGTVLTPEEATVVSAKRATYWTPLMGSASVSTGLRPERRAAAGMWQDSQTTQLQPSVIHRRKEIILPKMEICQRCPHPQAI